MIAAPSLDEWRDTILPSVCARFASVAKMPLSERQATALALWLLENDRGTTVETAQEIAQGLDVTLTPQNFTYARVELGLAIPVKCLTREEYREMQQRGALPGFRLGRAPSQPVQVEDNVQRIGSGIIVVEPTFQFDSSSPDDVNLLEVGIYRDVGANKKEARIDDGPPAVSPNVKATFADAVAALKSRLIPTVTDQDVAALEALIRSAQQSLPDDKEGFVRDVRRMLEAGGLRLQLKGSGTPVQIAMRNGSIQLAVPRRGGKSFRKNPVEVVAAEPAQFAPRPEQEIDPPREP